MTDNISKVVDGVNGLIKGLGGVRGILLTVANILQYIMQKKCLDF